MVLASSQVPQGNGTGAQSVPLRPPPVQGSRPGPAPSTCSYRGPNPNYPERPQQQPNVPFFYVQPSQPYLPYQWPMPCVPYGGFPGMGYGMILPPFPPAPYMEAPGYVLPHAQLHLMDYRHMMGPHAAPTMAYQARRFRYQNATPVGRVMVSSEVQTEVMGTESPHHRCSSTLSSQNTSESGRSSGCGSVLSMMKPNQDKSPAHSEENSTRPSVNASREGCSKATQFSVPNAGILFQTEAVHVECTGSSAGLKIVHSTETAELSSTTNGDLLQHSVGSADKVVVRRVQSVLDEQQGQIKELTHLEEQYLAPCQDILMKPNGSTLEEPELPVNEPANSTLIQREASFGRGGDRTCGNSSVHFKILHLPAALQCLDELQQMEASVWSVESLMPYVPSTDWMIQNGLLTPQKPCLPTVMEVQDAVSVGADESALNKSVEIVKEPPQDVRTSLESLSSTTWPAEFSKLCSGESSADQQQIRSSSNWMEESQVQDVRVQSADSLDSAPKRLNNGKNGQKVRTSGGSLSDQEGCTVARSGSDFTSKPKVRVCKNCISKLKSGTLSGSPSPQGSGTKRCRVQSTADKRKIPVCGSCLHDPEKNHLYKSNREALEPSENIDYAEMGPKKWIKKFHNGHEVSSGRHMEKCPMFNQSKLREQNCFCKELRPPHSNTEWSHGNLASEPVENLPLASEKWRDAERISSHHSEKFKRGSLQTSDTESIKSGGRIRTSKQKQTAQSPEFHRRDTRC